MKPLYQELPFAVDSYINFYREDLPHFIVPWHYHPEIEIMCIEKGWGTRFVGSNRGIYFYLFVILTKFIKSCSFINTLPAGLVYGILPSAKYR